MMSMARLRCEGLLVARLESRGARGWKGGQAGCSPESVPRIPRCGRAGWGCGEESNAPLHALRRVVVEPRIVTVVASLGKGRAGFDAGQVSAWSRIGRVAPAGHVHMDMHPIEQRDTRVVLPHVGVSGEMDG